MGIFHPQKSIRTEIEKSSTYNCLLRTGNGNYCIEALYNKSYDNGNLNDNFHTLQRGLKTK